MKSILFCIIILLSLFIFSCQNKMKFKGWEETFGDSQSYVKRLYLASYNEELAGGIFVYYKIGSKKQPNFKWYLPKNNTSSYYYINDEKIYISNIFVLYTYGSNGYPVSFTISKDIARKLFVEKNTNEEQILLWKKHIMPRLLENQSQTQQP